MPPDSPTSEDPKGTIPSRPLLLTVLCLFAFVLFGIITMLFLVSVFWSGRITEVINQYASGDKYSHSQLVLFTLAGFILHAISFTGIIMIWNLKKTGYYLFSLPVLLISVYQLFNNRIPISSLAIYIGLVVLFGLFFRKLH